MRWLSVIGIGEDGLDALSSDARALIERAELIVGGERHLAMVAASGAERLAWERPLARTVERIAERRGRPVVVLATGDPLWYGVGVTLARRFAPEEMTIIPAVGAFSLAAARMGWPLAECETLTLHGRPLEKLALVLAPGARVLILSEDGATPAKVARFLVERGWGESRLAVLSHLGGAAERREEARAAEWGDRLVPDLNTIALDCHGGPALSRLAGLAEEAFEHDGQITKRELRAATLAALAPLPGELLWDIGAGSGSIAIEWLRAHPRQRAAAIERDAARCAAIARNAAALGVPQLQIVAGAAPEALAGLPAPDAVFVGGGIAQPGVLDAAWSSLRPGGRLVANAVTLEGERRLLDFPCGKLARIAVSRAETIGAYRAWRPLMPVTQLRAVKP